MSVRTVYRVCYDAEYIKDLACPKKAEHSASISSLGAVGVVPGSGFVHACGCMANGFERRMIREFRQRLGAGNRFFQEEVKARLHRYMFSRTLPAGVSLYIPGHGLIVYYNWAYAQKNMVGSLRDGQFFCPKYWGGTSGCPPSVSTGPSIPVLVRRIERGLHPGGANGFV